MITIAMTAITARAIVADLKASFETAAKTAKRETYASGQFCS